MKITVGEAPTALTYTVTRYGKDILVHIDGGTSHLGAVTVAGEGILHTVVFPGHKEQFLTEPLAKAISEACNRSCCVTAGVHLEEITRSQIDLILTRHKATIPQITEAIGSIGKE